MAPGRLESPITTLPDSSQTTTAPRESHFINLALTKTLPIPISGKGIELYLSDGRTIIDGCGGAAVSIIGHGNEEVALQTHKQGLQLAYAHPGAYTTTPAGELCQFLLDGNPHGFEKVFLCSSGSEATETTMKLAKQCAFEKGEPERMHYVSRWQAYHGSTMGAMSMSTNLARKEGFEGLGYPHVSHVSPPYAYQYQKSDETEDQYATRLIQELDDEFKRVGTQKVLMFTAETVGGATAGCITPPTGYFRGVRKLCDKYGILLHLDEVMCGVGRTGTFYAFEQEGIVPDIVTIGKGFGGGYAQIAAVLIHKKVVDVFRKNSKPFNHGHTYESHATACRAALAVQKIVRRDHLIERSAAMGKVLDAELRSQLAPCKSVGDIRGRGTFMAVEFVKCKDTKESFPPELRYGIQVQRFIHDLGVDVYPGAGTVDGIRGDHILIAPPYTVTEEQVRHICSVVRQAVLEMEAVYM
ncbi:unnamed protein product [Periconia digitata]|uniref:Aminotransferase n=1 Tax=Periconia digitata TaxID=1303443 RepID=A0A9W4UL25_9PLEO|nr:unnamed protein product [Periconia digitata]